MSKLQRTTQVKFYQTWLPIQASQSELNQPSTQTVRTRKGQHPYGSCCWQLRDSNASDPSAGPNSPACLEGAAAIRRHRA
jgi:hypothetical protein